MLIKFKPNTPGQRGTVLVSKKHLSKEAPFKSLTKPMTSSGGRNNQGRITSRRIGGRVKRKYRVIDFKRNKLNINAEVMRNEYDPNRTSFISFKIYFTIFSFNSSTNSSRCYPSLIISSTCRFYCFS